MIKTDTVLKSFRKRYKQHGAFVLTCDESINKVVIREKVPDAFGIYTISAGKKEDGEIIYIGRSGTVNQDGSWGKQGIKKRLTRIQNNMPRAKFFKEHMSTKNLDGLRFEWFVTASGSVKTLPAFAEAELMQAYFNEHEKLPSLNNTA